ncbi:MAG: CDP-diacylglycerol--glycerol-3-phosphate 3-phosphatidyltransferase [Alphaproteobacteria bacterium]|nr:CDP-diacylglycerol--glycerol-3-phosphate 3-phosphatidyltransferase [Alphaproteobacteria bacterium]
MFNLPNILTISRIVVIPVIFMAIYIHTALWSILAGTLFIMASITDYLDGYLARARNQSSVLGRLLDPIADKLLVVSALLIIVANQMVHPITYIPVIIIMCREVLVSGLREFLAEFRVGMPVTRLAKWKTGFQMVAIGMILMQRLYLIGEPVGRLGEWLLWVAGVLTFVTGYQYFAKCLDYIYTVENNKQNPVKAVEMEVKKIAVKVKEAVSEQVKKTHIEAKEVKNQARKSPKNSSKRGRPVKSAPKRKTKAAKTAADNK